MYYTLLLTLRSTTSITVAISCPTAAVEEDVDAEAGAGRAIAPVAQPGGDEGGNLAGCIIFISPVSKSSRKRCSLSHNDLVTIYLKVNTILQSMPPAKD